MVPRRILPDRVLGSRSTTTACLKAATGRSGRAPGDHFADDLVLGTIGTRLEHQEAERHHALQVVGDADDGAFGDVRMAGQDLLDRARGKAVPGDVDHVVDAGHHVDIYPSSSMNPASPVL